MNAVRRSAHTVLAVGMLLIVSTLALDGARAHADIPAPAAVSARKPMVGACHRFTYEPATGSYHSKLVPCWKQHNVITAVVAASPEPLAGMSAPDVESLAADTCEPLLLRRLGGTAVERALSAYRLFSTYPSQARIQDGHRWFQCEVALGAGNRLLPLPARLQHRLVTRRVEDTTELCLTASHLSTTCSHRHAYRPVMATKVSGAAYPTTTEQREIADAECPVGTRWYRFTPEARWALGDRVLVCFAKTTR